MGDIHIGKRASAALKANNPWPGLLMDFLFKKFLWPHGAGEWDTLDPYSRWLNTVGIEKSSIPIRSVNTLADGISIWVITLNRMEDPPDTIVCTPDEFEVLLAKYVPFR